MNHFCTAMAFLGINMCDENGITSKVEQNFIEHLAAEGISYGTKEEYKFRLDLFSKKDKEINEINADPNNTFTVGHNMFSTMTEDEAKKMNGAMVDNHSAKYFEVLPTNNLQDAVDWRSKGAVNPVKNQGACGSCWTFGAIATVEGAHFIKSGKLLSLSEQEIVDCDKTSYGCRGGWQSHAFTWLESHGAELETDYPYTARDGTCKWSSSKAQFEVTGYKNVPSNSVSALKAAIAQQPVTVTIEADKSVFQQYRSGVLNSTSCGTQLDHAVAAVGYGSEGGQDYYIVRNSWGTGWGDQGYIKIAAVEGQGICGIQMQSLYPSTQ
jgi:C1A family cysteine protease